MTDTQRLARSEMPAWPVPNVDLVRINAIFLFVTVWERSTYPARMAAYRRMYMPRSWKDYKTQRYVTRTPETDVVGFRHALQGAE